jgi:ATP-dependent DNA ligase
MRHPSFRPCSTIAPCLPKPAKEPPTGPGWVHEIKHDGFRILARRIGDRVRLYTRHGTDFTDRFPRIVEAIRGLSVRSCFVDGEAIVVDQRGSLRSTFCAPGVTTTPPCSAPSI